MDHDQVRILVPFVTAQVTAEILGQLPHLGVMATRSTGTGPIGIVRAVLENACSAVWMLQPPGRTERLARRLRFAITDIRNGEEVKERPRAARAASTVRTDEGDPRHCRPCGHRRGSVSRSPGYKEIVQAAGAGFGPAADVIYLSWKLCSGMAHGDFWPA